MSLRTISQIASQGMSSQRERLEAASANLANAETTRTPEGGPYRRRDVVFEAIPIEKPQPAPTTVFAFSSSDEPQVLSGVHATTLINEQSVGVRRYQPNHPDADKDGYVTLPDVNPVEETVNLLSAARAFEANTTAFNTAKEMARATLKMSEA